jgi:hypothetical protein
MRKLLLAATSLALAAAAGCDSRGTAPTSEPAPTPSVTVDRSAPIEHPSAVKQAAMVVFTGLEGTVRTVRAVPEDGSKPAVKLSAPGVDTTYAGSLSSRRALLVEHAKDGSITAIVAVRAAGEDRSQLGKLPAGEYQSIDKIKEAGDTILVELARTHAPHRDVFALRHGAEPKVVAALSSLAAASGNRVAVVTKGNLQSLKLDGTNAIPLGGGDGRDEVVAVRGDRILITTHVGSVGNVRVAGIDGGAKDLGKPEADEKAIAITAGSRVVYLRRTQAGAVLVSVALDGTGEHILSTPELDAKPIHVAGDRIFFGSAAGALLVVSANGGSPRVLDPAAGTDVRVGAVTDARVIYVSDSPHWPALRAAALDGSGVTKLVEEPPSLPFFGGLMPDGRVVYYRALAGQLDSGRIFSVKLDGTDRRPLGTSVKNAEGATLPAGPLDQDFEAVTRSGRLILESEFEAGGGSQLIVGSADSDAAALLPGASHARFAALIE